MGPTEQTLKIFLLWEQTHQVTASFLWYKTAIVFIIYITCLIEEQQEKITLYIQYLAELMSCAYKNVDLEAFQVMVTNWGWALLH